MSNNLLINNMSLIPELNVDLIIKSFKKTHFIQ